MSPHAYRAKGVESRKRGHGVDLSTCINAACDRQLHFDMVRPFLRLRQLDFPRPVAGYDVRARMVDDKCIWPCRASRFQQREIGADPGAATADTLIIIHLPWNKFPGVATERY